MSGILTVIHTVNVARQVCRYQAEKFIPHKRTEIRNRTCAVILAANRDASRHRLRARDDNAGHPICLEKLAQFLFHDRALAARRVTHENFFAIAHDDSSMKHIEILARRRQKKSDHRFANVVRAVALPPSVRHFMRVRCGASPGTTFRTRSLLTVGTAGIETGLIIPSRTLLRIQSVM